MIGILIIHDERPGVGCISSFADGEVVKVRLVRFIIIKKKITLHQSALLNVFGTE